MVGAIANTETTRHTSGTKRRNGIIGFVAGGLLGGGGAASIGGGIGIAPMGTAVDIPFGALILLGVGVGGGVAALAAAAFGQSARSGTVGWNPPAVYSPWYWGAILLAGFVLIAYSVSYFRKLQSSPTSVQ